MRRTIRTSLTAALLAATAPVVAVAAPPDAGAPAAGPAGPSTSAQEVNELIRKGHEAMRNNQFRQAIDLFDRARVLTGDSPRTIGEVGFAEQGLGDWISSEGHLRSALSHSDDPWVKQHQDVLQDSLKVVQKHIGELVVTGPEGSVVTLDTRSIGKLPMDPVRLLEGKYKVALKPSTTAEPCSPVKEVEIVSGRKADVGLVCQKPVAAPKVEASVPAAPAPAEPAAVLLDRSPPITFGRREIAAVCGGALLAEGILGATVGGLFIHDKGADRNKGPWLLGAGIAAILAGGALTFYGLSHDEAPHAGKASAGLDGVLLRF